jgi:hypothetical protein
MPTSRAIVARARRLSIVARADLGLTGRPADVESIAVKRNL